MTDEKAIEAACMAFNKSFTTPFTDKMRAALAAADKVRAEGFDFEAEAGDFVRSISKTPDEFYDRQPFLEGALRRAFAAGLAKSEADKVRAEGSGRDEIIRIAEQLSSCEMYGAAQLIYRLIRERDEASAGLAKGEAERAALVEALKPFADAADFIDNAPLYTRIDTQDFVHFTTPDGREFGLSHKECKAARAALALVQKGM